MDYFVALLIVGAIIAYFCYMSGKRTGSRKGFHAGRSRRRGR